MTEQRRLSRFFFTLFLTSVAFLFGLSLGDRRGEADVRAEFSNITPRTTATTDFAPFWDAWNILNEWYIFPNETNNDEKLWGAIAGLAASFGDPYTSFFPPVDAEIFEADISGEFQGVGMEIGIRDNILTVIAPLKGSPAEKAGILAGDLILEIDEMNTASMSVDIAVSHIRGTKGSVVNLLLYREGSSEPFEISVTRDVINIPTIDTKVKDGVFIIELYTFSANSPALFREALREFIASGSQKLILDLRGNPGGYLEAAVDMASFFLPAGDVVVKEDRGEKGEGISHKSYGYDIFSPDLKMIILINRGSASASEILAGALSQHGVAKLVGTRTFGKGSVQEIKHLSGDSFLKITVARWLTPDGTSISDGGLQPDVEVFITPEERASGVDRQLEKALELLYAPD